MGEFGLGTNIAIGRKVVDNFEGDVAAKNNHGIEWHDGTKNAGDGGDMGGVLTHGTVKLVFVFAVGGDLRPVHAVAVSVDPAEMTFGFKNEDSPLVDGEAIDLEKFGVGDDVILDTVSIGFGVGLRKIGIDEDIF